MPVVNPEDKGHGSHDQHNSRQRRRVEVGFRCAAKAESDVLQTISGMIYSGSYALVYAAVFVGQSLPKENPVMNGFRDGGRAVIDELGGGN